MNMHTDQPRTPAGSPQGGQFATNPGGGEGSQLTPEPATLHTQLKAAADQALQSHLQLQQMWILQDMVDSYIDHDPEGDELDLTLFTSDGGDPHHATRFAKEWLTSQIATAQRVAERHELDVCLLARRYLAATGDPTNPANRDAAVLAAEQGGTTIISRVVQAYLNDVEWNGD